MIKMFPNLQLLMIDIDQLSAQHIHILPSIIPSLETLKLNIKTNSIDKSEIDNFLKMFIKLKHF